MKRIVILTSGNLRHTYVRKALALMEGIEVVQSYCENKIDLAVEGSEQDNIQACHLQAREISEQDFFGSFVALTPDHSHPVFINAGEINQEQHIQDIIELVPDVLVAFGCSLIKSRLLQEFKGRFLNVHLGLSPYYRGSGTNFWPLVNGEPEFVGATFMHIDAGVDTGEIIHQTRPRIYSGDGPHDIGNRLIADIPFIFAQIIGSIESLKSLPQPKAVGTEHYYRRSDFSLESTQKLYQNFSSGMIDEYLSNHEKRLKSVPIVENPLIKNIKRP